MKKILASTLLVLSATSALASGDSALSIGSYYGSINNNTGYVLECSQMVGGYCANNPMPANGYIQMLPDPGATQIRGHIMAFDKDVPGAYTDNLLFTYSEQDDGTWAFDIQSLDKTISIDQISADTVVLNKAGG